MKLNIGTLSIGNKVLENVSLEGISTEDFLKLISEGDSKDTTTQPVAKAPVVKKQNTNAFEVPDGCVMGIMGIVEYSGIDKKEARLLQVAGLPVYKTISCDKSISPKGVTNLYLKKDIDTFIEKRRNKRAKNSDKKYDSRRDSIIRKPTAIKITNETTGEVSTFPSITKAAKAIGISESTISSALNKGNGHFKNNMFVEKYLGEIKEDIPLPVSKPVVVNKWLTYSEYYDSLRKIIKEANKDMGKTLSEAYKDVTNIWGINWVQAKKDYRKACGDDVSAKTLRIAYWIEANGIYNMSKGMLKESVEHVLKKDQPPQITVIKRA